MWGILIALLSGALMSIQGVFNTEVTRQSSIWVSADCVCHLSGHVVIDGKAGGPGNLAGEAMVYVIRRCDRRIDHMDGDPQCGKPGTCQICPVDRSGTDCCGLWDRGIWAFWSRKERLGVEKSDWGIDCRDWNYYFPEIMLVFRK